MFRQCLICGAIWHKDIDCPTCFPEKDDKILQDIQMNLAKISLSLQDIAASLKKGA